MSPNNNSEKIIGPRRRADARGGSRRRVGFFLLFPLISWIAIAHADTTFERAHFGSIRFSDACNQKQWTTAPDNSLELLMSPSKLGPCEATLTFYASQDADEASAITYEARSTRSGPYVQMGFQEQPDGNPVYGAAFPLHGLSQDWQSDMARLARLENRKAPKQIAALHFVVLPNPDSAFGPGDSVMIRGIRLAVAPPEQTASALPPSAVSHARKQGIAKTHPVESPSLPSLIPLFRGVRSAAVKSMLPLAGAALLLALAAGSRGKRRRILSPLYEINTRTWKTHRDANDVVQFGGFKKIGPSDLKAIKQSGFNAIWLMGIWEVGPKVRAISKNYGADFQGSPFAIFDYSVSSDLGSEADFRDVVQRAHNERLSVIVDFVPNHMGLDSAWLNDHPEYFVHRVLEADEAGLPDDELIKRYPSHFPYRTPSYPEGGRRVPRTLMVAYGKDPYFYPWIDTAQLDYAHPGLRQRMIDVLCHWAKTVDGVRCDMAMLILREQVKIHRHPEMSWDAFNQLMPAEFWTEAIQAVKRVNPNFVFLAETYWSMEGYLQKLGFDYTYNKPLYEAICSAMHGEHAEGLMNFIRLLGTDFLKRSVHFLENHDEERAMNALGEERQRPAAAILCTLPGIALIHQGQLEGKRERMPVQRVVPLHQEPELTGLQDFYHRLLRATALPVFQEGRLIPLYSNNSSLVSYARVDDDTKVLVIVNSSSKTQKGSVFVMPGLRFDSGTTYRLNDLFYEFKTTVPGSVQPCYEYTAAQLINQGLYVELQPFDAHIFIIEPQGAMQNTQRLLGTVRQTLGEWPANRVVRRVLGTAFSRSSDTPLATNPASRQQ